MPGWFEPLDQTPGEPLRVRRVRKSDAKTSARAAIAASAFLILLTVASLVGGHAALDPLLRSAMEERSSRGVGEIVLAMPDGKFCRHMSFDNATAEVVESGVESCPENIVKNGSRSPRGFAWGEQ